MQCPWSVYFLPTARVVSWCNLCITLYIALSLTVQLSAQLLGHLWIHLSTIKHLVPRLPMLWPQGLLHDNSLPIILHTSRSSSGITEHHRCSGDIASTPETLIHFIIIDIIYHLLWYRYFSSIYAWCTLFLYSI